MILALVMALALVACGNKNTDDGKKDNPDDNKTPTVITNPDKVQDEMTSSDGKYEVAFVTDVGQLKDKSFNQGTYDGVKLYAANNGLSYKYYQPANGSEATDDDRFTAMKAAVDNGAKWLSAPASCRPMLCVWPLPSSPMCPLSTLMAMSFVRMLRIKTPLS